MGSAIAGVIKTVEAVATPYGAAALAALRKLVAAQKANDPLAPVTILVPNNIAGLSVRRHLARGVIDGRPGIAGIFISTLPRLAEQLAAASLHPRTPATATVVAAAWRSALDAAPGVFAAVANHPATIRALATAHRELRDMSDTALDAISSTSPLHASLIELHRTATKRIAGSWYDETDLLVAATDLMIRQPARANPLGPVILYLPQRLTNAELRFARSLAAHTEMTVLAGLTGDIRADEAVNDVLHEFGAEPVHHEQSPPVATQVVHASDSDDEVRRIVREVIGAIEVMPAHRIAVLHSGDVPYARLLHEQLTAAGITFNGRGTRAIAERSISRGLLGILAFPEDLPRAALFRALAEAPARRLDGTTIPLSRWERASRAAGIVGGNDWDDRLDRSIEVEKGRIAAEQEGDAPQQGRIDNAQRQIETAEELKGFVGWLRLRLADAEQESTWAGLSAWALELFHDLYGQAAELGRLPAEEQYAAAAIDRILQGFSGLDAFGIAAGLGRLSDLLVQELEAAPPRVGRFGEGVFVGPVSAAVGLDVDLVIVAGLAEDAYPGRRREDALLGAEIRELSVELPDATDRLNAQHRHLLAAFGSAPWTIATFPRGDLRRSTQRLPSRWLLPTLRVLTGRPHLVAVDWERYTAAGVIGVRSYAAELLTTPRPATEQEWRTRAITAGEILEDNVIDAAVRLTRDRASRTFTRYDGNLAGAVGLPDYSNGQTRVSPTALETYATCPHSFFVGRLLGVEPLDQPEEIITISPLDIGNLIHHSMDEFIQDRAGSLPTFGAPWSDADRRRLQEIATAKAEDFVARGATGHPLLWERERLALLADLDAMLTDDNAWRRDRDAQVIASELTFGMRGFAPVAVEVPRGRVLMVGSADKIDMTRDGVLLVTDIKTGSARRFEVLKDDPVAAGTKLQLPVYAHAARQRLGGTEVEAQYWFVRKNRGERIPLTLSPDLERQYAVTIGTLVDAIAAGHFPAKPPDTPDFTWVQCRFCNPDGLGHSTARDRWERKRFDPALAPLVTLIEPDTDLDGAGSA